MEKEKSRAYHAAIRYLAPRARSAKEMRDHLNKKGITESAIMATVERLERENLLDDREFAALFIEQRERFNPKSHYALTFELKKKGIDETIIHEALEAVDESESAWHAIAPKLRLWQSYDDEKFKKKVMNHLRNRGFGYHVSITTFKRANSERDELK